jgi:hypothetical protein
MGEDFTAFWESLKRTRPHSAAEPAAVGGNRGSAFVVDGLSAALDVGGVVCSNRLARGSSRHAQLQEENSAMMADIESGVLQVIVACRALGVPDSELDDMANEAKAGEPGIALENLCTQLFEYGCGVSHEVLLRIEAVGNAMGLKEAYWKRLRASAR